MKRAIAKIGVVVLAIAAVSAMSGVAEAGRPGVARVRGAGEVRIPFLAPDKDVRRFEFDVVGVPYSRPAPNLPVPGLPTDARGWVRISHYVPELNLTVWSEGEADCLVTTPGGAAFTAVITKAHEMTKDWVGRRVGFSVHDGRPDRVGFSWTAVNLDRNAKGEVVEVERVGTCMAPAAFSPVVKGGYTVEHADLVQAPGGALAALWLVRWKNS